MTDYDGWQFRSTAHGPHPVSNWVSVGLGSLPGCTPDGVHAISMFGRPGLS